MIDNQKNDVGFRLHFLRGVTIYSDYHKWSYRVDEDDIFAYEPSIGDNEVLVTLSEEKNAGAFVVHVACLEWICQHCCVSVKTSMTDGVLVPPTKCPNPECDQNNKDEIIHE